MYCMHNSHTFWADWIATTAHFLHFKEQKHSIKFLRCKYRVYSSDPIQKMNYLTSCLTVLRVANKLDHGNWERRIFFEVLCYLLFFILFIEFLFYVISTRKNNCEIFASDGFICKYFVAQYQKYYFAVVFISNSEMHEVL